MECGNCGIKLPKGKNAKNVKSGLTAQLKQNIRPIDVLHNELQIDVTPHRGQFLCKDCCSLISKLSTGRTQMTQAKENLLGKMSKEGYLGKKLKDSLPGTPRVSKMKRVTTPCKYVFPRKSKPGSLTSKTSGGLKRAILNIRNSKYNTGLKLLYECSKSARNAFRRVLCDIVRKEIGELIHPKSNSIWRSPSTSESFQDFSWDKVIEEATTHCPTLFTALLGASTTRKGESAMTTGKKVKISVRPNIGTIIGQLVFIRNKRSMTLLQKIIGVQLWLSGCGCEGVSRLNHLGLCLGNDSVRRCIDHLRVGFDSKVKKWKEQLSNLPAPARRQLPFGDQIDSDDDIQRLPDSSEDEMAPDSSEGEMAPDRSEGEMTEDLDRTMPYGDLDETLPYGEIDNTESLNGDEEGTGNNPVNGYTLVFDNVNQKTMVRHSSRAAQNKMFNMVQAYAARDRIPVMHLSDEKPLIEDIKRIPIECCLPNGDDRNLLRYEYETVIQRVICSRMKAFESIQHEVTWHIPHEHVSESKKKSEMVCLGVLDKNEAKIADMVDILEHYHQYVPSDGQNPIPIILYGDGLSCERVNDAQNARINAADSWSRLEGLEPAAQEWHKRGVILQDTYEMLYSGSSARDKGTLFHIRNTYRHKGVKKDVLKCFNNATELLWFATEAYIIAAACCVMKVKSENDVLQHLSTTDNLHNFFLEVCNKVTDMAFDPPSLSELKNALNDNDLDDDEEEDVADTYCICKEDRGGDWVKCENRDCPKGLWFHLECMNLDPEDLPEGDWFCSEDCKTSTKVGRKAKVKKSKLSNDDCILEYTKCLMWRGIGDMVRNDAIKENDGSRIIMHWKYDIMEFYEHHHPKYLIFAFNLLTNVGGAVSTRMAEQLMWNRTVNPGGGHGKNIEMDLQMEHFNKNYKESIKSAGGQLTTDTIGRHSQMVGIGKVLQASFDVSVAERQTDHRKAGQARRESDLSHLVKVLTDLKVFQKSPGRVHTGFPEFYNKTGLQHPVQFVKRLIKHKKRLIKRKTIITN